MTVLVVDFLQELGDRLLKFFGLLVLLVDLVFLILDLAVELVDVGLDVLQFVRGQLQLSLRLKTHIRDLCLVVLVLVLNVLDLISGVLLDLLNDFFVLLNDTQDLSFLLVNLILLDFHLLPVSLSLGSHLCLMLGLETVKSVLVGLALLILLGLQFLETSCVLQHLLRVLVTLLLDDLLLPVQLLLLLGAGRKFGLLQGGLLAVNLILVLHLVGLDVTLQGGDLV